MKIKTKRIMMILEEYTTGELEAYEAYLDDARKRIIALNKKIGNNIEHLFYIDISDIKKVTREEWSIRYRIYKPGLPKATAKAIGPINGTIRYQSFDVWKMEKLAQQREDKLKQIGL